MSLLRNTYVLGRKELQSLRFDRVLVVLIAYAFTLFVYILAKSEGPEVRNASIGIVDEDRSQLSGRLYGAFLPPYFKAPVHLGREHMDRVLDAGELTFVLDVPPGFQAALLAGSDAKVQVNVDATAVTHAGPGAGYIASIVSQEIRSFLGTGGAVARIDTVTHVQFNPNLEAEWFLAVMQIVNAVTMLSLILPGAALIREREHGTVEHLLVLPLRPVEIMLAKVWANALVIVAAVALSLEVVVQLALHVPIAGSVTLFLAGTVLYLIAMTSLSILLATVARSMPRFGLLVVPTIITMNLLSGGSSPFESMPEALRWLMQLSPSTHFVSISQAILYRGAGFEVVWRDCLIVLMLGLGFFCVALARFRRTLAWCDG
ncbi:MAG: ABC transporter permease [Gammaproteobacteria bacterium]